MLAAILRILALARKELLAILKDPKGRSSLFMPPIIQCLLYGYAATYDLNAVPYAVMDRDHSAASHELVAGLDGSGIFYRVAELASPAQLRACIDDRQAVLVIQIDQDFQRRLLLGQPATVQVIADGRNSNTAGTALGYVQQIVQKFNADWLAGHPPFPPEQAGRIGADQNLVQLASSSAISVVTRAWYNPNLETRWYMIPALIGTLTMLQTLLLTTMSVAREREEGTFDQLLVTPLRPAEIMAGKALPSMLVGTVQAINILLVGQLWFHIPFAGSYLTLAAGLTLFLAAAVGIGLLISSMVATMQQAMLFSFMIMMPFALLSGLTTPVSSMPLALQWATLANPLRYAIDIARRVYLEGATLGNLVNDLWPLALMAALTLSVSSWMFRHRLT